MFGKKKGLYSGSHESMGHAPKGGGIGDILKNIAGHVGDTVSQHYGGAAIYGPQQARKEAMDFQAQQQAEILRRQATIQAQRTQDARDLAGYRAELKAAEPAKPGSFEWYQTANPQERATYDQYNPFVVTTGQGPVAVPRSSARTPSAPAVGSIEGGYEFLGGDPANPNSWRPVPKLQHNEKTRAMISRMPESTEDYLRSRGY